MNARWVFIYGALLLLLANGAYAGGAYQRTKDGKTIVWNNDPKPRDAATWSGDRDADRYATGYGTLTWYREERKMMTGSNVPSTKLTALIRYSGKMAQGKLEGPVTADEDGKTFHAKFVDGHRSNDWAAGPAPSASRDATADQQREKPVRRAELVEAPAEGPEADERSDVRGQMSEVGEQKAASSAKATAASEVRGQKSVYDDSLRSLVGPPASLRTNDTSQQVSVPTTSSSPPAGPRLTEGDVIHLADTEAGLQGYNLIDYKLPQVHYNAADDTWSASYEHKPVEGAAEKGKHFSVRVEDKTRKTTLQK